MKRNLKNLLLALFALLFLSLGAAGCVVHARPAVVFEPTPVVVAPAPARVYYSGHWLYYRSDAYYLYEGGTWVVAPAVPAWVAHYHRPLHVYRSLHPRPWRPHVHYVHRHHRRH